MIRIVILLLVIAAVAGFFTRPDEPVMREAANAVLADPADVGEGLESIGAAIAGNRSYNNYQVAAKYTVTLDDRTLVECWGAFQQVQCTRPASGG